MTTFKDYGITGTEGYNGQIHTTCPECSHERKKANEKCLSVNINEGTWFCHHCGWSGALKRAAERKRDIPDFSDILQQKQIDSIKSEDSSLFEALTSRGITEKTIRANGIFAEISEWDKTEWFGFPYFLDGKCVNIKYRSANKEFRQTKDGHRVFYRLDSIREHKQVVITEGEIDALSFCEAGIENVLSVPDGAIAADARNVTQKLVFIDNSIDKLEHIETFYLALDSDAPGRRMTEELARRLGKDRCKTVIFPEGCKDANDVLLIHGKEQLYKCLDDALDYPIDGVYLLSDSYANLQDIYDNGFQQGVSTNEWPNLDRLIKWFAGHFTVVTGIPSHGKSNFIDNLLVNLARHNGWRAAVFSPENPTPETWVIRLLEIATGRPFFGQNRIEQEKLKGTLDALAQYFYLITPDDSYTLDVVLATAKSLLRKVGINALVIDPWNNLEVKGKSGENETAYTARVLVRLRTFARQTGVHVILIAHPRKMQKNTDGNYEIPTAYDISGSAHFYNVADNIVSVYREFLNDSDDLSRTHVFIQKVKTKYSGQIGCATFDFDKQTQRYMERV
jgi:twinkle protein